MRKPILALIFAGSLLAALALLGSLAAVAYAHKAASAGTPVAPSGTTYALVVGISDYYPCGLGGPDLQFADDDADSFATALTTVYGVGASKITKLENCDATKTDILNALTALKNSTSVDDDLVVFVSGHGTRVFDSQCGGGTDSDRETIDNAVLVNTSSGLDVICDGELKDAVTTDNAGRKVVILDISFPSGFKDDFQGTSNTLFIAAARGEARESAFASGPCYPGHGLFTCLFVVRGIIGAKADNPALNPHGNNDGLIPFEEAYDYTVHNSQGFFAQKPSIVDNVTNDVLPGLPGP